MEVRKEQRRELVLAAEGQRGRNLRFLPPLESPFFPSRSELTSRIHESLLIPPDPPVEK